MYKRQAPEYVKEELAEADAKLEQKAIGRDALVFIVNEENPVQSLTQQQLRDIYAGRITSWKDVGGADAPIVEMCIRDRLRPDGLHRPVALPRKYLFLPRR